MPHVKRIQEKYGKDKFEVLLLSVDLGFRMKPGAEVLETNKRKLMEQNVDWPNVLLPRGFEDTHRRFNIDAYGLTLIGSDGLVKGINIHPETVDKLLAAKH